MLLPDFLRRWPKIHGTKSVLALSGALMVALLLLAAFVMNLAARDIGREADKDALNIAQAIGQEIARNLELYDMRISTIARQWQNPSLQAMTPALRWMILFDGVAHDANLGFINVLNEDGDIVADSGSEVPRSGNFASRDYFRAQIGNPKGTLFIGEPFDKSQNTWTMIPLSRRAVHQNGSFAGVVMGSVRLDYFTKLFSRFSIGGHGTITLLLDNGMILQRRPAVPTEVGHIPDLNLTRAASGADVFNAPDPVDRQTRRFVLYHPEGLPLVVAVGLAPADIYAAWNTRANMLVFPIAVLGVLGALLIFALWRAVSRQEADAVTLDSQRLKLQQHADEHSAMVAEQQQAHERRERQLDEVAHDMRTQLHSLLSHAGLVQRKGTLNAEQTHHLKVLRGAGEQLRAVVERFLHDACSLDGSGLLLKKVDIRDLVRQCSDMFSPRAEEKGLHLAVVASDELPASMQTDTRRISAILSNLLENAIRYTDRGSVVLNVSLESTGLRFELSDTGPGMPDVQKRRLLQGHGTTARSHGATGRGLTIVRRHLVALGGKVSCSPRLGGGSIIRLDVPVVTLATSDSAAPCTNPAALRLLVVDDSPASREATAEQLRAAGHAVTTANSGEAAVERISQTDFDGIVLDGRMPGLSGSETAGRIRALPGGRGQVPIVVLSATSPEQGLAMWQQAGISAYVTKSGDISALLHAICQAIRPQAADAPPAQLRPVQGKIDRSEMSRLRETILNMRNRLNGPETDANKDDLSELVHRIAGDAAVCGLSRLAAACRWFEQARVTETLTKDVSENLILAADGALTLLCQRLHEPNSGDERSAKPMV